VISRPYKFFLKKIFIKKLITLTHILSLINKFTAILFSKKVWITFLFFYKNIFSKFIFKKYFNYYFLFVENNFSKYII
jgi:hypothetical protein